MHRLIVVALFALLMALPSYADHPSKRESDLDDGGLAVSESFKRNYLIYRDVGGKTEVKGKQKKRKWWCGWLCKRRVSRKVDLISVQNTYFSEISPGVFSSLVRDPKTCTNASSCRQREFAVGFTFKIDFTPGVIDNLLPVDGVITQHRIVDGGGPPTVVTTSKGKHPGPIIE